MPISVKNLRANFRDIYEPHAKILRDKIKNAEYMSSDRERSDVLDYANKVIGGFGTEEIRGTAAPSRYFGDAVAVYVNTGDTYSPTVLYDIVKRRFYLTSFGDFVERHDRDYGIGAYEGGPYGY